MKYVHKTKDGWHFNPPQEIIDAGIGIKRKFYKDGRSWRYEVPKFLEIINQWKKGKLSPEALKPSSKLVEAVSFYKDSNQFNKLSKSSQTLYSQTLTKVLETQAFKFGKIKISDINASVCRAAYEQWLSSSSVGMANQRARVFSVVMNFLCSLDLRESNPMSKVKKQSKEPETTIWTREQVEKFFATATAKYEYRNVGLIAYLCYEWGQRPKDICNLTWKQIDWVHNICTIKQSKRGATVYLPISDSCKGVLQDQYNLYDFQPYVAPYLRPSDKTYQPYTITAYSRVFKNIRSDAGLPEELKMGALRKTAIVEARDGGADSAAIMNFSGHKNIQSLNPYLKNTPKGAKAALDKRKL